MATITCRCGAVRLEFPVASELFRHECCCHDCIAALWYGTKRGGPEYPHDHCADCSWLPNDFRIVSGAGCIGAFMNHAHADTTRFHCTACWTVLFGDHPFYEQKIVVSQVASYQEYDALTEVTRMAPQARHFLKDLTAAQRAALPPWPGEPARVYDGVATILLDSFPAMKAAGGAGTAMNAQILLAKVGGAFVPENEPRLSAGPPSLVRQGAVEAPPAPGATR